MRKSPSILGLLIALAFARNAHADAGQNVDPPQKNVGVIERVVAIVGHEAIFLTELRSRSKPFIVRIDQTLASDPIKRAAAISEMQKDLLDKMIDEALIAKDAVDRRISVTPDEIDRAVQMIAGQQKLGVTELMKVAEDQGLTRKEYREEIGRQLLEGKLLQIRIHRIKGLSALSEEDRNRALEDERRVWVEGLRERTFVEKRL